jgi:transcriptional regulator with XRE-family HTH domain
VTTFVKRQFGENLCRFRKRAKISQEELGFRASLHRTEVGELERGARMPQLDTILKLAAALSISPCELIEGMAWVSGAFGPPAAGMS